jgi:hypothetical protein
MDGNGQIPISLGIWFDFLQVYNSPNCSRFHYQLTRCCNNSCLTDGFDECEVFHFLSKKIAEFFRGFFSRWSRSIFESRTKQVCMVYLRGPPGQSRPQFDRIKGKGAAPISKPVGRTLKPAWHITNPKPFGSAESLRGVSPKSPYHAYRLSYSPEVPTSE